MPSTMTNGWLRTELQAGEFPQMRNYEHIPKLRSCTFMVKVTLKYTLLGRLWSMRQAPWQSQVRGRSYKHGNSLRCEIRNTRRSWDRGRLGSKWRWNIHYWVASEAYAKYHDDRLATDRDIHSGIPPRTKLKTMLQAQFLHVSGQSDVEIYIIGPPLKYMPSAMTIGWLWMELQPGEFPKMRNYN